MPEAERILQVVHERVVKAGNDLKNATHTLTLGAECPTDTVCFHAQQCIEKSIKENGKHLPKERMQRGK